MSIVKFDMVDLSAIAPRPRSPSQLKIWQDYVDALLTHGPDLLAGSGITTPLRLSHLLATWAHESDGFTILWENMNYTTPERISEIFGANHSAKVSAREARALAHHPAELAERVYGLGNPRKAAELGNTSGGDGFAYRGFGIGQITGRSDHERLINGEYTALGAIRAALKEWTEKGCNAAADRDDVVAVRRKINGGSIGLSEVRAKLAICKQVFTVDDFTGEPGAGDTPRRPNSAAPPRIETTGPEIAGQGSRSMGWIQRLKMYLNLGSGSILGLLTLDNLGIAKAYVNEIKTMVTDNATVLVGVGLLGGILVAGLIEHYLVEAAKDGRYSPRDGA